MHKRLFGCFLLITFGLLGHGIATAQAWPTKPVRLIVPFPPGGSLDPIARIVAAKLHESLKQPFVVENKPGAAGAIGTAAAVSAPPDGYTFVFVFDTHAVNPALMPSLPYDTRKDLTPVMLIGKAPMAIVTQTGKPFRSFADVVQTASSKPRSVSYGTMNGTLGHLTMTLLQKEAKIQLVTVPYKGGAPMVQDALGGQIDLAIGSPATVGPYVKSGKMRALAVTSARQSPAFPNVPTLTELGYKGLSAYAWWAIFAPAGTPKPILAKFHSELAKVFSDPEVRKTLVETQGMEVVAGPPEELDRWLGSEMDRWARVVKENDIQVQ
ncbi:tripartite tricarboxylate transporter substrate binding protein [Cupriavidus sp. L7L]|uniref:tripartite tricarboxylate transporter substrate binding protein n=1 Tax=Cupriavidus sp. L7L TaxID=2546443 RepID=UPI00105553EB|nr:tripartite tricarboxylate transporter substrate binding protein [Cupriavidus sp. L7L]TDF64932.1 tripartite tricarboxylate transporter substrate binding protein [Cupriavidus sp. L7L]